MKGVNDHIFYTSTTTMLFICIAYVLIYIIAHQCTIILFYTVL